MDQVARLIDALDRVEQEEITSRETGKAILLHAATAEYLQRVRNRNWPAARERLTSILVAIANMISALPENERKDS